MYLRKRLSSPAHHRSAIRRSVPLVSIMTSRVRQVLCCNLAHMSTHS